LSKEEVHKLLHRVDTAYYDYGYLYDQEYYLLHHDITADKIISISFHETWEYDSINRSLVKNVKGIILNSVSYYNDFPQGTPLFYIPFDGKGQNGNIINPPQVYSLTYDFHTQDFGNIAEAPQILFNGDSMMGIKNRNEARMIIGSLVNSKKTTFYDGVYPYNKPLDKKIVKARLPEFASANAIGFMEDWYVDLNRMTFTKAMRGIILEKEMVTEQTQFIGDTAGTYTAVDYKRLAFVPTNNYQPEKMIFSPLFGASQMVIPGFIYRENFFRNPLAWNNQDIFTDSAALMKMCVGICDLAQKKKLWPYYDATFNTAPGNKFTAAQIDSLFMNVHDTVSGATMFDQQAYWNTPFYYPKTNGLAFKENWSYDSYKNTFQKQVQSIAYLSTNWINSREGFYAVPLFFIDAAPVKDTAALMKPEFLVAKNIESPVMIDHSWETDESVRKYSPQAFKNESVMDATLRYRLVQEMINSALAGKITVYDGEKREMKLSPAMLRAKIDSLKDNTFLKNDLPTDYLLFRELIFVEDWYFNPATGELYKKVKEIIFVNSDSASSYEIDFGSQKRIFAVKLN
jgi:hypothetical protein